MPTRAAVAVFLVLALVPVPAPAAGPAAVKAQRPIKVLVNAIRYGKDDLAAAQIAFAQMAQRLLGDAWGKLSEQEQQEAAKGLETIIRAISFTKGKEMFAHLDALLYGKVEPAGDDTLCKSTIVVHRNYKKVEMPIDWVLVAEGGRYKVVDMVMLGESTLKGLREEQVLPLLAEGGPQAVLAALRAKVAEVTKK